MSDDNNTDQSYVILAPDEPEMERMQKKIMDMLENGRSVNDIAISLRMDPEMVQGFADKFNKTKWQSLSRTEIRNEHLSMLNEMAEIGKLQYMSNPVSGNALAVASLIKIANEVERDLDTSDSLEGLKDSIHDAILQTTMEQLVISLTKDIGQAQKALSETVSTEKRPEVIRIITGIAQALAIHSKVAYDEAVKRLDAVFEENVNKSKVGNHKKQNKSGIVSLVPHVDPR